MRDFYASFEHLPPDATFADREYLDAYLEFVEEHKRLFKVFLENVKLFDGFGILMNFEDDIRNMPSIESSQKEQALRCKLLFMASGITSIVSFWLESGCRESREQLRDIILECVNNK